MIGFVENAVAISYPMLCKTSIARGGVGWEDSFYASMTMSVGAIFLFLFQTFISPVLIHKLGVWQTIIILTGFVPFGTIILPLASNAHILVCILILTIGYILSYTMLISALLPINIAIINSVNHHH